MLINTYISYMKSRQKYFIYSKDTKEIVTFCDKGLGRELLDLIDPLRASKELGWRQQVVAQRTAFCLGGREIFDVFPHDGSQRPFLSLPNR